MTTLTPEVQTIPISAITVLNPRSRNKRIFQELVTSIASLHKNSYIKSLQATVDQIDVGDIRAITAPVHFIVGADDPLTPPAMHHEMAAKLRGAPVSVLPRAGHLSNIENGDGFNEAAVKWLLAHFGLASAPERWPVRPADAI